MTLCISSRKQLTDQPAPRALDTEPTARSRQANRITEHRRITTDTLAPSLYCILKEYGQSLQMRGTKEPSGAQNKPQSKTIEQAFACGTPYNRDSRRWQEIREAIATYICKDMAPIYTVEKQGFRALMKKLDSRYTMPSRKHFTQVELPRLYHECRAKVEGEIHQVAYYAMTDMWTSRTIHPYMSLTVHFIQD